MSGRKSGVLTCQGVSLIGEEVRMTTRSARFDVHAPQVVPWAPMPTTADGDARRNAAATHAGPAKRRAEADTAARARPRGALGTDTTWLCGTGSWEAGGNSGLHLGGKSVALVGAEEWTRASGPDGKRRLLTLRTGSRLLSCCGGVCGLHFTRRLPANESWR